MNYRKILMSLAIVCSMCFANVMANTYENGAVFESELGYIEVPEDSSYIKFSLPQGEYPKGSKAVVYAQTNVFCYIPGLEYKEPTVDANPYRLAAEYKFTDADLENLKNGSALFTTTLKFDIMCGGIRVVISGGEEKPNNNLVEDNREQGATESEDGKQLTVYADGDVFESSASVNGGIFKFIIPQGSYTLGDYIIVSKDGKVVKSISISKELMDTLVNANVEYSFMVDFADTEGLKFGVSSYIYDEEDEITLGDPEIVDPVDPSVPSDPNTSEGMSPMLIGLIAFLVVLVGGFASMKFGKKKETSSNNEVTIYQSDEAHQIEDNRIIEAETTEKEDKE